MAAVLRNASRLVLVLAVAALLAIAAQAQAKTVARCGAGWLEMVDGYRVLHLKGTPYEMGYQHGALLKEDCRQNLDYLLNVNGGEKVEIGPLKVSPRIAIDGIVAGQRKYVPKKYFDEMDGLAAAAEVKPKDVYAANFIPELFHCSGFALMKSATKDGTLYHGRVLDYFIDWRLQEHAVLIVAEPAGGIPFVNVTYAGFVGSVTGMNAAHVSIGEMGGHGLGHWQGEPMAFLVRDVLETAADLDAAVAIFRDNPRTCEYYYVIADGKSNRAVGMAATWQKLDVIQPGQAHPQLPHAVPDTVLMSAGDRYEELVRRVKQSFGQFDAERAIRLMDRPVAMKSNLHDALFAPASTRLWVANASKDWHPACEQQYHAFQLTDLLARKPESSARTIPMPTPKAAAHSDSVMPVAAR